MLRPNQPAQTAALHQICGWRRRPRARTAATLGRFQGADAATRQRARVAHRRRADGWAERVTTLPGFKAPFSLLAMENVELS
jgi:hypothetical protein